MTHLPNSTHHIRLSSAVSQPPQPSHCACIASGRSARRNSTLECIEADVQSAAMWPSLQLRMNEKMARKLLRPLVNSSCITTRAVPSATASHQCGNAWTSRELTCIQAFMLLLWKLRSSRPTKRAPLQSLRFSVRVSRRRCQNKNCKQFWRQLLLPNWFR